MTAFLPLSAAIAEHVHDGDFLALEGFAHLIPFAAGHEIIRQQRRELTLLRLTPDILYDQLVGCGCARKLIFSWLGNPGVGSLHRLRDAIEHGFPHALELDERSHAAMTVAYAAGAARLPMGICRGYDENALERVNTKAHQRLDCPFTGERLLAVEALNPDVTILHAHQADRQGNILLRGIVGVQREIALAAGKLIVTVERVVEHLARAADDCVLPHWIVEAVCEVPYGAYPSYAFGEYERDNAFYLKWSDVSKSRTAFQEWIDQHVLGTRDHQGFLDSLRAEQGPPA